MRRMAATIAALTSVALLWSGAPEPAVAKPPPPPAKLAPPTIDAHLGYMPQSTCSPSAKPGTSALLKALIKSWGGSSSGISRHCGVGSTSEHKEGRALDWRRDVKYASHRTKVNQALNWLTANNGEVAYRLGVMYIIWNQRIWSVYYPELGWRKMANRGSYTANHKNHVHISLSWDGAMKQTSWWTGTPNTRPLNSACGKGGAPACLPTIARTTAAWPYQETVVPSSFLPAPWVQPALGGSPQVGRTLTAVPGTWVPAEATLSYQWRADGRWISGATGPTYVIPAADLGRELSVRVTAVTGTATRTLTSSATAEVIKGRFTTPAAPKVTGTAVPGQTLSVEPVAWSPEPDGVTYAWLRNGKQIKGQVAPSYAVTAADVDKSVTVRVTATRSGFTSASVTSRKLTVKRAAFAEAPLPTIAGTGVVGEVLSAEAGAWAPQPSSLLYQWYVGGKWISGATSSTLRLPASLLGKEVHVRVKSSLAGFTTTYRHSLPVVVKAAD